MRRAIVGLSAGTSIAFFLIAVSCAKALTTPLDDGTDSGVPAIDSSACPDADVTADPNNCGGCGHKCTGAQVCASGVCKNQCDAPQVKCPAVQACVDLTKDPSHCGTCTTVCNTADAGGLDPSNGNPLPDSGVAPSNDSGTPWDLGTAACVASKCTVTCMGKLQCNGICFDPLQDHDHCGDCMTACPSDQACTLGHCCLPDEGWCNGACVDVSSDNANCGTCGTVCSGMTPNCSQGKCIAGLTITVEGHAPIVANCKVGDYSCEAHEVCNKVTNSQCVFQQYDCATGSQGSWYPNDGMSGSSAFNFAYGYDLWNGNYGNICACTNAQMTKYGLSATHTYCGLGHWQRQ